MSFPASGPILSVVFVLCLATLAGGALIAVGSARLIRNVCGLAISSFGLAGLYYFLNSPFLALMEILVYVGAVCVTFVFAIMLAEPDEPATTQKRSPVMILPGVVLAVAACASLAWLGVRWQWPQPAVRVDDGSIQSIGYQLLTKYSMAFELISLALLVAILGALAIARSGRTKP